MVLPSAAFVPRERLGIRERSANLFDEERRRMRTHATVIAPCTDFCRDARTTWWVLEIDLDRQREIWKMALDIAAARRAVGIPQVTDSLKVALVVGTILNLINQGDAITSA